MGFWLDSMWVAALWQLRFIVGTCFITPRELNILELYMGVSKNWLPLTHELPKKRPDIGPPFLRLPSSRGSFFLHPPGSNPTSTRVGNTSWLLLRFILSWLSAPRMTISNAFWHVVGHVGLKCLRFWNIPSTESKASFETIVHEHPKGMISIFVAT